MTNVTIGCLLHNSESTKAGSLEDFFQNLDGIESKAGIKAERVFLLDEKTSDRTEDIARKYCNPTKFSFENFSQARNLLLERAGTEWVLMVEPDMRYDEEAVAKIIKERDSLGSYKCVEAFQTYRFPNRSSQNFYYILISSSLRFDGLVFETLMAYPHQTLRIPVNISDHFTAEDVKNRNYDANEACRKELVLLEGRSKSSDPAELYWAAMRYNELGLTDCFSREEMDVYVTSLLEKALAIDQTFGPAYYELAKQHLYMGRNDDVLRSANLGIENGYSPCSRLLPQHIIRIF